ncbi:MAG: PDZ domain-containing protein [bacterium]|nr:PDZ domain-containing protein [bacterium]
MNQVATGFEGLFAFVLMLGVLVTVHEFGHYIVAKLCGVRVLKFSIGFGPPIGIGRFKMAWTRSGTEYVVAWIPLGGYVKMLGENPGEEEGPEVQEDPAHSLPVQPMWKKLSIFLAGPAMNLMLPVLLLMGTLWVGIDRAAPVIGTIEPASPAARVGLEAGDRIVAMNGETLVWWQGLEDFVRAHPGEEVELEIEREGAPAFIRSVPIETRPGIDRVFRDDKQVGWLGVQHSRQKALLGLSGPDARAAESGLRAGDRVVRVGEREVEDWAGFVRAYRDAGETGQVRLRVMRPEQVANPQPTNPQPTSPQPIGLDAEETPVDVSVPALGGVEALGVIPAVVLVVAVSEDMPAARAGIEAGDLIVAVDGQPIGSFLTFQETVLGSGGRSLEIQIARDGQTRLVPIAPQKRPSRIEGSEQEEYLIGIQGANAALPGAVAEERLRNPWVSVPRAVVMTYEVTRIFLRGLRKLVTGEISRKAIGGPIEIAKQSHTAFQAGWDRFLQLLMLISINLGILNLLPSPILDGGQALIALVEGVKRGPLTVRTRELVQQVGLILLVALMSFALWNDVSRNWSNFFDWMRGL